ncbi:MAG: Mth938-like domain-containing protein [Burkholderiales bacterium]|nr:Mth938-like domain-containing protein [Burkholderiales bacterium]
MKLHLATRSTANLFTGYGEDFVTVNERRIERSLVVLPDRLVTDWRPAGFEALNADHIRALAALEPEVILLGTGNRLRFPPPGILRPLTEAGIGVEVMDVPAACRTYNILLSEGRRVAAALLLG